jgi:hypothetical protein
MEVRYDSAIELGAYTSDDIVPTDETDAIVIKDIDVDATSIASVGGNTQATLYIDFTLGSLTNCTVRIYQSYLGNPTATDWYQETSETESSGALTLNLLRIVMTADTKKTWHFPIGASRATRITIQGSGTQDDSLIHLRLGLRSN